jgi:hypothetical protein
VVLIHQHGLAHALLDHLEATDGARVFVFTGHDHEAHYHQAGDHLLLDGGTLGAGGPFAIGEEAAGFALLHLDSDQNPLAIDLIQVEPVSGEGTAQRIVPSSDVSTEEASQAGRLGALDERAQRRATRARSA